MGLQHDRNPQQQQDKKNGAETTRIPERRATEFAEAHCLLAYAGRWCRFQPLSCRRATVFANESWLDQGAGG
jgi:hypothetical protein